MMRMMEGQNKLAQACRRTAQWMQGRHIWAGLKRNTDTGIKDTQQPIADSHRQQSRTPDLSPQEFFAKSILTPDPKGLESSLKNGADPSQPVKEASLKSDVLPISNCICPTPPIHGLVSNFPRDKGGMDRVIGCLRILLQHGADPNAPLIEYNNNIDLEVERMETPIQALITGDRIEIDRQDQEHLPWSVWTGSIYSRSDAERKARILSVIDLLLEGGAKLQGDELHLAADSGDPQLIDFFLEKGADINRQLPRTGFTPIHSTSWGFFGEDKTGTATNLRHLIAKGAALDIRCKGQPKTALGIAIRLGHKDAIKCLLKAGADRNAGRGEDNTPAHEAVYKMDRDHELAHYMKWEIFDREGFDPNVKGKFGATLLHTAAWLNNWSLINALLMRGADPNLTDYDGWLPTHYSEYKYAWAVFALYGQRDGVKAHTMFGGKVIVENIAQAPEFSPAVLFMAVRRGQWEMVDFLLENGMAKHLGQKDNSGRTPLHTACEVMLEDAREISPEMVAKELFGYYTDRRTPTTNAIMKMIEAGADPDAEADTKGRTPRNIFDEAERITAEVITPEKHQQVIEHQRKFIAQMDRWDEENKDLRESLEERSKETTE